MAVQGPFKVQCADVFPHGVGVVGAVQSLSDFDKSTADVKVQQVDKESGLPVWTVDVMDFDPQARERTFKVKIAAAVQPVPPPAIEGAPVRPVILDGMTVTPWIKETGMGRSKIAYSVWASGLSPVRKVEQGRAESGKAA